MTATATDLFCGAGGSSAGAESAGAELRLALNHWERAIETHATNFQHADHDCNDVAALTTAQIRVFPAASAIDWSLPAERIGDRKRPLAANTRKRIRRGLERMATDPFAIRLTHGGAPKPLTLPIVTLTQRHDMAMVMPVAGNTHESTPGNRARDAASQPMDTVLGTLDRAMVVPPMGAVAPRDADAAPAPVQTTTTRPALVTTAGGSWSEDGADAALDPLSTQTARESKALVMANRANNVGDGAERAATPPVLTGEHLAVVMRNNQGGAEMSTPDHEPIRTLTRACHQSLLIPYQSGNEPGIVGQHPAPTLTTRDRLAMVVPYTRNGRPRDAGLDIAPTATAEGPPAVVLSEGDIDNCRFRMFALHEIAATMAFADDYVVIGNKRERMAQYGNAVTPPAMELLVSRLLEVIG